MSDDRVRQVLTNGPHDAYQRLVLAEMALSCNQNWEVAVSHQALASLTGLHPGTVKRVISVLCDAGFLDRLPSGGFRLARARGFKNQTHNANATTSNNAELPKGNRARARENECVVDPGKSPYRAHPGSTSSPVGQGARASLGWEGCQLCGGTGWMEVAPPNRTTQSTVDVCTCRGGPEPYIQQPVVRDSVARFYQGAVNLDGLASVREVLANESQTRAGEEVLGHSEDTDPGT